MDELIVELPDDENLQASVKHIEKLMVDAMAIAIPDVLIRAEPALMYRWYKEAEAVYNDVGTLLVWTEELNSSWQEGITKLYSADGTELIYENK